MKRYESAWLRCLLFRIKLGHVARECLIGRPVRHQDHLLKEKEPKKWHHRDPDRTDQFMLSSFGQGGTPCIVLLCRKQLERGCTYSVGMSSLSLCIYGMCFEFQLLFIPDWMQPTGVFWKKSSEMIFYIHRLCNNNSISINYPINK